MWDKKSTKMPLSSFCVGSWAWGLPWSMGNRPSDTPLEWTDLFSLERVPIADDTWWRVRAGIHSLLSALGSDLPCTCPCSHSLYEFICISVIVSGEHCRFGIVHHLYLLPSSLLLFYIGPWGLRRGFDEHNPCRTECSSFSSSLLIVQL